MGNAPKKRTAPKPADSAEPATEDKAEAPLVVNIDGHDYTILPEARDDFELLDDLYMMQREDNSVRTPSILRRMLGPEQMGEALERLRDPDTGRVTVTAGALFVGQLLEGLNPN